MFVAKKKREIVSLLIEMALEAVNEFEEYLNEQNTMLEKIYVECGGCDNE